VVRIMSLALAMLGALGLAAERADALSNVTTGSEAFSALIMGAVLLLLGAAVRRTPITKE
jgi:hypothetical protein